MQNNIDDYKKAIESCKNAVESSKKAIEICEKAQKNAILAIKISLCAVCVCVILGLLSLWTLLNQVTVSVGIDKKLIQIESQLNKKKSEN